jgi:MIP family channel proteins
MHKLPARLTAEALGTFALIFIGCGAVIASSLPGAGFGLLGIALAHALVLGVMVTATMNISGAHINPAVTIGMMLIRRISPRDGVAYIVAQLAGAVLGAYTLKLVIPGGILALGTMGTPALANAMSFPTAIGLEAVLTFFLMSAVMGTAVAEEAPKVGGFGIGLTLVFDILVGGPLTGAAMNPARAFAPALLSGTWYAQLVWWIGPIIGAVVAAVLWEKVILRRRAE